MIRTRLGTRSDRAATADVPSRIEALAEAVELADGRFDEDEVAFGRHVVAKATDRLRHGTTHTLVALLGATGGGKSSIANALVGSDVATTGVRRPTTSSTLACYWGDDDVQPLLDWLGVDNRHRVAPSGSTEPPGAEAAGDGDQPALDGLVLLDVPDHDSVAVEHRLEMERIAEQADLLLWVTDAEKYGDKAMHDYLRRLSGHGAVTALVLNKADQLPADDLERCRVDLQRLLTADGLDDVEVVTVSARTGAGMDELRALLAEAVDRRQAMIDRLAADARMAAEALLIHIGDPGGGGGSSGRAGRGRDEAAALDRAADELAAHLVDASGLHAVTDAVAAGYRRDAAARTGWPFTRWARRLRPHPLRRLHLGEGSAGRASLPAASGVQRARSENAIRQATAAVTDDLPDPWPDLVRAAATPDEAVLADRLDTAIADAARAGRSRRPRWWGIVNAFQGLLALAVVVGAGWLALLAFAAYLRIPEPPTPEVRGFPVPTGLLIGGIALGLLTALVAARLAAVGARRRARAVRRRAEAAVQAVTEELVVAPMRAELDRRRSLRRLLRTAAGQR